MQKAVFDEAWTVVSEAQARFRNASVQAENAAPNDVAANALVICQKDLDLAQRDFRTATSRMNHMNMLQWGMALVARVNDS